MAREVEQALPSRQRGRRVIPSPWRAPQLVVILGLIGVAIQPAWANWSSLPLARLPAALQLGVDGPRVATVNRARPGTAEVSGAPTERIAPSAARAPWSPPNVARVPFTMRIERWRSLVQQVLAEAWDEGRLDGAAATLDDDLILALIQQESAGNPNAESWVGALGLMQVMPFTFAEMMHGDRALAGIIPAESFFDPSSNVRAGIRYLALAMQAHEGNLYWALASYNAGIEAVADWRAVGLYAVPPIGGYRETAEYTQIIMRTLVKHRPGIQLYIPDPMPDEHVPGAVRLLKDAGRW